MIEETPLAWANIEADAIITREPAWLVGVIVTSNNTTGAADATVYHGTTTDGRKIGKFKAVTYDSRLIPIPFPGLPCPHGIYVDVGSNVDNVLVIYRMMPD